MKLTTKLSFIAAGLMIFNSAQASNKTFINCVSRAPSSFSPALVMEGISYNASSQQVYNRLIEFKRGSTDIEPALAESWQISDDGLTYTFHLRKGVKFHKTKDYQPSREFNADDVIFSFQRQLDKTHPYHEVSKGTYPYFNAMKFPKLLQAVEKVDDYTVKITLTKPDATFLASLGMDFISIYSAEYADKMMKAGTPEKVDTTPIGTGPFIFAGYQLEQKIRFLANPDYWQPKAEIDRLIFDIVPDAGTRYAKLQSGACDMIDFPNIADLAKMKADPKIQLMSKEGLNIAYIAFNTEKAPFDNVKVRQAIQNDWAKAGVKAKLVSYEWGDYIKRTKAGELTAGTYGWSGDNGDPDNFLSPLLGTENIGNSNYARWSNAEFDALLSKAISLSNQAERAELYKQAQVIAKEQAPWITVAHSITNTALSLRVKDYKQSPFGYSYFYGTKLAD
ncbi:hypothetical protein C4O88_03040 [Pasteurellaceae bacterium 12591]|nr:hypothetical protein C4O88_03040 [Pasteurellaceae bacterium 12591]